MIFDGRAVAERMLGALRQRADALAAEPSFLALAVSSDPATESYLRMKRRLAAKVGIRMDVRIFDAHTTEGLIALLKGVQEDAVIVQLPLPDTIDTRAVLEAIPIYKDADVLSSATREAGELMHPVAGAVQTVLAEAGIAVAGKKVTVVGYGWLVGQPAAEWLRREEADVTVVTKEEGDVAEACRAAEIVVSGVGVPGLIRPEFVTPGSTVIDIGTSELGGSLSGDVDPAVADVAGLYTPVPGGVGPITVARLMENVILLAERNAADGSGNLHV